MQGYDTDVSCSRACMHSDNSSRVRLDRAARKAKAATPASVTLQVQVERGQGQLAAVKGPKALVYYYMARRLRIQEKVVSAGT